MFRSQRINRRNLDFRESIEGTSLAISISFILLNVKNILDLKDCSANLI